MAGLTRSSAELSLLSLAMAVTASLWLLFAQPAQGHRALRPASFGRDAAHTDSLGIPVESDYECGYFNLSDPKDAGIPHQPCYGDDGIIQFCCISGSSKCSCPLSTGSDMGCYNYEDDNNLNSDTGTECAWSLPKRASLRRQLATCTCPQTIQPTGSRCPAAPEQATSSQEIVPGLYFQCRYGE